MSVPYNTYKMFPHFLILFILCCLIRGEVDDSYDYFAEDSEPLNWTAVKNLEEEIKESLKLTPDIPQPLAPVKIQYRSGKHRSLPRFFDSRKAWPNCSHIIGRIRRQGGCGSCWAVNAASVMSDRVCIGSGGKIQVHLSAEELITCCSHCLATAGKLCNGGYAFRAFQFWQERGLVSGGEYNSKEGCKPYRTAQIYRKGVSCSQQCPNGNYTTPYSNDTYRAKVVYRLPSGNVKAIQEEIRKYGPVMGMIVIYTDFLRYRRGVYRHKKGARRTNHFIKIIGWGVENGERYWLCTNSWGTRWGLKGLFKILRGRNHVNIERAVTAGRITNAGFRELVMDADNSATKLRESYDMCFVYLFMVVYYMVYENI